MTSQYEERMKRARQSKLHARQNTIENSISKLSAENKKNTLSKNGKNNFVNANMFSNLNSLNSIEGAMKIKTASSTPFKKRKVSFHFTLSFLFISFHLWNELKRYYNSNCYIGTSYRGDTLSNSQFDLMK